MTAMKQLTKVTVKKGKVEGRVTLKLESADGGVPGLAFA
jgi:hypothetical protein